MTELVRERHEPDYRAAQLMDWLYGRGVTDLDAMTDLPAAFRQALRAGGYGIRPPEELRRVEAPDGTVKFLFNLADGARIESVFIPEGPRRTVCISTQVGCGMGCVFCATAQGGLVRNLSAGEIVGQVIKVRQLTGGRITNVVAMGQGEPLANYDATVAAFHLLGVEHGVGIAARHLAISTCGLPAGIGRLAVEGRQWQLTVSLHAAHDALRDQLMPINRSFPLAQLKQACLQYCTKTGRRITFAYVLIAGLNDSFAEVPRLAEFCQGLLAHVNLIPWNTVPGIAFAPPGEGRILEFQRQLAAAGINTTVRRPRGAEFAAACGQLSTKPSSEPAGSRNSKAAKK